MSKRYKPTGTWSPDPMVDDIFVWGAERRFLQYVNREVADVLEGPTGRIWKQGAWRVNVKRPTGCTAKLPRSKTFIGESAWRQSRAYAEDAIRKIRLAVEGR